MPYTAAPKAIALASHALELMAKATKNSGIEAMGLPGIVPPMLPGTAISYLSDSGFPSGFRVTNVKPEVLHQWIQGVEYDAVGMLLYDNHKLYRVEVAHEADSIEKDLWKEYLQDVTDLHDTVRPWEPGKIWKSKQLTVYNGQLLQSTIDHVSQSFCDDCCLGHWKFIANLYIGTVQPDTAGYSYAGHVVSKDNILYACIKPHTTTQWTPNNWVCLQPNLVTTIESSQMVQKTLGAVIVEQFTDTSAQVLSGHTAVVLDHLGEIAAADSYDLSCFGSVYGVIDSAYLKDSPVRVIRTGYLTHEGWSFIPNKPIFLGRAGALTQDYPTGAVFLQVIGIAKSPTSMVIMLQPPTMLSQR